MTIATQTAHFIDDGVEAEIMEVLQKHYGEDTPAGRSIDSSPAIVALGKCMIHLLAQFDDEDRKGLWETFARKSDEVHAQLVMQSQLGGSA